MIGQTADGTIWIWGLDYGQASRWTQVFAERVAMVKQVIDNALGAVLTRTPIPRTNFPSRSNPAL